MSPKIRIENLAPTVTDDSLKEKFVPYGQIIEASIGKDAKTGRAKGFGYVTFGNEDGAQKAIHGMDGQEFDGKAVEVTMA